MPNKRRFDSWHMSGKYVGKRIWIGFCWIIRVASRRRRHFGIIENYWEMHFSVSERKEIFVSKVFSLVREIERPKPQRIIHIIYLLFGTLECECVCELVRAACSVVQTIWMEHTMVAAAAAAAVSLKWKCKSHAVASLSVKYLGGQGVHRTHAPRETERANA